MIELRNNIKRISVTVTIAAVWVLMFAADRLFLLMPILSGRGFAELGGEWYRLFSGALLHANVFHLAVNCVALWWIGRCIEERLKSSRFAALALISSALSQAAFFALFPRRTDVFGGSIVNFSLIGVIVALKLLKADLPKLSVKTRMGGWITGYSVLGNLPIVPLISKETIELHTVCFVVGFLAGLMLYPLLEKSKAVKD